MLPQTKSRCGLSLMKAHLVNNEQGAAKPSATQELRYKCWCRAGLRCGYIRNSNIIAGGRQGSGQCRLMVLVRYRGGISYPFPFVLRKRWAGMVQIGQVIGGEHTIIIISIMVNSSLRRRKKVLPRKSRVLHVWTGEPLAVWLQN
jgi:hypothetical protein